MSKRRIYTYTVHTTKQTNKIKTKSGQKEKRGKGMKKSEMGFWKVYQDQLWETKWSSWVPLQKTQPDPETVGTLFAKLHGFSTSPSNRTRSYSILKTQTQTQTQTYKTARSPYYKEISLSLSLSLSVCPVSLYKTFII